MTVAVRCRAKNPATCRTHGTPAAPVDAVAYLAEREARQEAEARAEAVSAFIKDCLADCDWGEYRSRVQNLIDAMTEEYGTPMIGRTRAVFDLGDGTVMKVAITDEGEIASGREKRTSEMKDPYTPVAQCEWADRDGVDVLIMEKVRPVHLPYKDAPDWVGTVDCGQVGYTADGRLVAYDL